jgi:lauroyl/myristoyl acyltransferase
MNVIARTGAPRRELVEWLRQGHILMIMGDVLDANALTRPSPYVLPVTLLGRCVPLNTGPFRLARWLNAPVLPFFVVPCPTGFAVRIERPLPLSGETSVSGLRADLTAFADLLGSHVARYPALWANWGLYSGLRHVMHASDSSN